jgi:hypothetical protein
LKPSLSELLSGFSIAARAADATRLKGPPRSEDFPRTPRGVFTRLLNSTGTGSISGPKVVMLDQPGFAREFEIKSNPFGCW